MKTNLRAVFFSVCLAAAVILSDTVEADQQVPFDTWLESVRAEALSSGVSADTLSRAMPTISPVERVLELDRRQPEFMLTLWRYMELFVPDSRVERGKALLAEHKELLSDIEKKYGVPPRFLVAFWGVETNFGQNFGAFPMISSVATLAYDARRSEFFRKQLMSALRLVERGDVMLDAKSSWAGAMGNMQFIPTTFEDFAIDYDGDGRRDLWNNLGDAFASAANYLSRMGWQSDFTWGREVVLPAGFDFSNSGLRVRKSLADWQALGIRRVGGGDLPQAELEASVLLPAGASGPAFLVYKNFRTIMRWNASQLYAIAVGHLADRYIGLPRLSVPKPANAQMLKFTDISEMQRLLTSLNFDTGGVDGRAGPNTRAAIRAFQSANQLPADGHPTFGLLERLRNAARGG